MSEQDERQRVIEIARTYLRTPYHPEGRLKGVGVDCLTLLVNTYEEAKLIDQVKVPHYPPDFMQHRSEEKYLNGLLDYSKEVEAPQPGDIALWKFGRCFSHAAIVIEWPKIIHAQVKVGVVEDNVENAKWLKFIGENTVDKGKLRPVKFFSYWSDNGIPTGGQESQDADNGGSGC
jgi:cell wall-associated NlpC family hydrolase